MWPPQSVHTPPGRSRLRRDPRAAWLGRRQRGRFRVVVRVVHVVRVIGLRLDALLEERRKPASAFRVRVELGGGVEEAERLLEANGTTSVAVAMPLGRAVATKVVAALRHDGVNERSSAYVTRERHRRVVARRSDAIPENGEDARWHAAISQSLDLSISSSLSISFISFISFISQSLKFSISQSLNLSNSQSLKFSISQSLNHSISQSLKLSNSQSPNLSISQSYNLPISQSLNLSIS